MMAAAIIKQAEVENLLKVPAIFWHKSLIVVLSIILQNNPFLNLTLLITGHSVKCRNPVKALSGLVPIFSYLVTTSLSIKESEHP